MADVTFKNQSVNKDRTRDHRNFSADLKRISYWIYNGQNNLANSMLDKIEIMYKDIDPEVGCYKNIWDEIKKNKNEKSKERSAERSLTASVILFMNANLP